MRVVDASAHEAGFAVYFLGLRRCAHIQGHKSNSDAGMKRMKRLRKRGRERDVVVAGRESLT